MAGKKKKGKTRRTKKHEQYEIKEGKAVPKKNVCPKCGSGVFMAEHKDRMHCGKCGYTKWNK